VLQSGPFLREVLAGREIPSAESVRRALRQEYDREASQYAEVRWYGNHTEAGVLAEREAMVLGLLADLGNRIAEPVLSEAGFIAPIGKHWVEGHVDLIYRPAGDPTGLGLTDWKTGKQLPHQNQLDHGYESGIYSAAVRHGAFVSEAIIRDLRNEDGAVFPGLPADVAQAAREARSARSAMHTVLRWVGARMDAGEDLPPWVHRFDRFPTEIHLTYLADYVPYSRKSSKTVNRPDHCRFFGVEPGTKITRDKGQQKGPAWYQVNRSESDIPRLEHLLRRVVSWIRFGHFVESVGEKRERCQFRNVGLTEGYDASVDESREITSALRGAANDSGDLDGLGELDLND